MPSLHGHIAAASLLFFGAVAIAGCDCRMREMRIVSLQMLPPESCLRATIKRAQSQVEQCQPAVIVLRNACSYRIDLAGAELLPGTSHEYGLGNTCPDRSCELDVVVRLDGREAEIYWSGPEGVDASAPGATEGDAGG